jgi:hypothetical protein
MSLQPAFALPQKPDEAAEMVVVTVARERSVPRWRAHDRRDILTM